MERVYDSEEEYYSLRPQPKGALPLVGLRSAKPLHGSAAPRVPQTESKSKTETKPKGALPLVPRTESKPKKSLPLVPQTESEPKDNIKDVIKTKPTTEANPPTKPKGNIYSKIKFRCEECNEEFKNNTTHSYSHNRKYLENTEPFDINSSEKMKKFYITD